ncbi:hypothetical protein IEO21_03839 [Rhodonia placenta]|uniref:Uncharacterized protein n=1 Tax=Rhodonia placenta TaxID=104341 RepID=A0A8H7U3V5_9APHY|nr:hypothetical protein IEO21_03839 [Postia placenta]
MDPEVPVLLTILIDNFYESLAGLLEDYCSGAFASSRDAGRNLSVDDFETGIDFKFTFSPPFSHTAMHRFMTVSEHYQGAFLEWRRSLDTREDRGRKRGLEPTVTRSGRMSIPTAACRAGLEATRERERRKEMQKKGASVAGIAPSTSSRLLGRQVQSATGHNDGREEDPDGPGVHCPNCGHKIQGMQAAVLPPTSGLGLDLVNMPPALERVARPALIPLAPQVARGDENAVRVLAPLPRRQSESTTSTPVSPGRSKSVSARKADRPIPIPIPTPIERSYSSPGTSVGLMSGPSTRGRAAGAYNATLAHAPAQLSSLSVSFASAQTLLTQGMYTDSGLELSSSGLSGTDVTTSSVARTGPAPQDTPAERIMPQGQGSGNATKKRRVQQKKTRRR